MSFYSYKNANPSCCPGTVNGNVLDGLNEKICIQVHRVYDSCLQQQQLTGVDVTITSYAQVVNNCCCNANACCGMPIVSTPTIPCLSRMLMAILLSMPVNRI